ncbi:MAG TPA: glycosyltransferase family 2 protein [Amphiplicatus sp.]|nr:glycosyltransferase family 2 protein [Amphiplicatus sp.]HOP19716.1 glycosyltransferase family 2 protein [Amphiplicatus sp.]HRX38499.1 glycosyltransferase family 2 protein [Parvularculaceae bacterium]
MTDDIRTNEGKAGGAPRWSVVIPFYNEEKFLQATLDSIAAQKAGPIELILVDNASTDASHALAEKFIADAPHLQVILLTEMKPGQAAALETGIARASAPLTAICDADTIYPPTYLETAEKMFEKGGPETVAAIAFGVPALDGPAHRAARRKGAIVSRLMPNQCHGGGYAHAFRTDVLKSVGGYSQSLWPFCLKDHELINRVIKKGRLAYSGDHWCLASDRRGSRKNIRWTLPERLLYHVTPREKKDWFFYEFLRKRFEARGLSELKLRERDWETADTVEESMSSL